MKRIVPIIILLVVVVGVIGYGGYQYFDNNTVTSDVEPVNYDKEAVKEADKLFKMMQKVYEKYNTAKYKLNTIKENKQGNKSKASETVYQKNSNMVRVESDNNAIFGSNGNNIWFCVSGDNKYYMDKIDKAEEVNVFRQAKNNINIYKDFFKNADTKSFDYTSSNKNYILRMIKEDGKELDIYVDKNTFFVNKEKRFLADGTIITTEINDLELGLDIDNSKFTPPKNGEKIDRNYVLWALLGKGFEENQQYEKALKLYNISLQDAPFPDRNLETHYYINRGNCFVQLGKFEKANNNYRKAYQIKEADPEVRALAMYYSGSRLYDLDKKNEALEILKKSTQTSTDYAAPYLCYGLIGKIYYENREFDKAIKAYKKALNLAESEKEKEEYRDAINYIKE